MGFTSDFYFFLLSSRSFCPISQSIPTPPWVMYPCLSVICRTPVLSWALTPSYFPGQPCIDMDAAGPAVPGPEEGAVASGWMSQPSGSSLQPLAQWSPYPEYVSHEAGSCPYSADMYVQPVCPSYTLVGPSSVLTYTSQPLITNFAVSQKHQAGNDVNFHLLEVRCTYSNLFIYRCAVRLCIHAMSFGRGKMLWLESGKIHNLFPSSLHSSRLRFSLFISKFKIKKGMSPGFQKMH